MCEELLKDNVCRLSVLALAILKDSIHRLSVNILVLNISFELLSVVCCSMYVNYCKCCQIFYFTTLFFPIYEKTFVGIQKHFS